MSEIKAWDNTVGQQIEKMTVDLVAQTAAGVSEAAGDVFFVGRPAQNGTDWILKKITPTELEKMVYNYLTSNSIAPQLAAVLGGCYKYIQANDNLNDEKFRVAGDVYICNASARGNTITNCPLEGTIGPFRLEIVPCAGNSFPMQRLYRALKSDPSVYVRYYEGGWGAWKIVTMTSV